MESNDLRALSELYLKTVYEAKAESPEEEEEKDKEDDDLAGSPNKNGKKNGKKVKRWWDDDGDGKGYEKGEVDGKFPKKKDVKEAVYGGKKEEKKDTRMVVTAADKKANTPAYQNYKAGMKKKDGSAMYKAADHMKEGHSTDTKGKKNCGCGQDPCVTYGKQDKKSMEEGYGKKKKKKGHDCASKVKHEEYGFGDCIKEMHTLDEEGNVTHYDVMFESKIVKNIPVSELVVIEGMYHEHVVNDEKNQEVLEDYETKKKGEVLSAMKKQGRKLSDKDKDKIANKVVASKGDTSKSDDRYAYEEVDPGMEHNLSILRMLAEKEVNVKDTKKVVDAIRAYDKSKDASRDATDDSDKGDKEGAAIEKKYAAKERGEIKKDDPNWKKKKYHTGMHGEEVEYDELDNDLLEFAENTLCNFPEDEILDMMESMWHRRNPGKKHPLESGSSKVKRRPVSDQEKKSTDKEDRMYVAMRRVTDRQKGYSKAKSDAAGRLHDRYTTRQAKRKKGASPKEASAQSFGEFGGKDFAIKRGGRKGKAPATDRGTGNKAARRAGQEVKDRDPRKK